MNWNCPYCNRQQVVTQSNFSRAYSYFSVGEQNAEKLRGIQSVAIRCLNQACGELTVQVEIVSVKKLFQGGTEADKIIESHQLKPFGTARRFPSFIPAVLREDYEEACLIADLSPKAAATLARRCIQGMIRDFCEISARTLYDEIAALEKKVHQGTAPRFVDASIIEAFNAVRHVGNVGAHMEGDINVIVDVDPHEAKLLLRLIETLFEEWYIARQQRIERLANVATLADKFNPKKRKAHVGPPQQALPVDAAPEGNGE